MKKLDKKTTWKDWAKMLVIVALYIWFLAWVGSWWGLIVVPFIFDAYITKKIPWTWWKELENPVTRTIMSWVDAIVFALVAVYFVNIYFFQNYTIPSSSLEKSLLVMVSAAPQKFAENFWKMVLLQSLLVITFGIKKRFYRFWMNVKESFAL